MQSEKETNKVTPPLPRRVLRALRGVIEEEEEEEVVVVVEVGVLRPLVVWDAGMSEFGVTICVCVCV